MAVMGFSTSDLLSEASKSRTVSNQKKKSHEEIKKDTQMSFQKTEEILANLRKKKETLEEQIANLERKQANRRKFLEQ